MKKAIASSPERHHTQARGRTRRKVLLNAARLLLAERDIGEITLPAVAEYAGIPTSSCYHFYPEIKELYKDLVRLIAQEMIEEPIKISSPPNWEYVVAASVRAVCDFYNRDYAATQLMLGSKTAPEIKREGCSPDIGFGDGIMNQISTFFILPYLENPKAIFFRAIQVADAMFQISIDEHDRLTEEYREEATNVMVAYLALYLPRILPRQAKLIKSVGGAARKM